MRILIILIKSIEMTDILKKKINIMIGFINIFSYTKNYF